MDVARIDAPFYLPRSCERMRREWEGSVLSRRMRTLVTRNGPLRACPLMRTHGALISMMVPEQTSSNQRTGIH